MVVLVVVAYQNVPVQFQIRQHRSRSTRHVVDIIVAVAVWLYIRRRHRRRGFRRCVRSFSKFFRCEKIGRLPTNDDAVVIFAFWHSWRVGVNEWRNYIYAIENQKKIV